MDRKVLIYSATEHFDDMPVGDKDDDEESRLEMKQVVWHIWAVKKRTPGCLGDLLGMKNYPVI